MKIIKIVGIIALCISIIVSGSLFFLATHKWIDFSALEHYNPGKPSILLDDEDNEWARFEIDRRAPIHLKDLPNHLVQAFLAAEDHMFFSHNGISYKGIIRSTLINLYKRRIVQGASTITQQLVKLLFFNAQRTFKRKIKEQLCALLVEQQFTKEQILETYLNHIYFGCGIYGVEAAAQRFWGKSAQDVTLEEAAILAGIVRSPGIYCPLINPTATAKRRTTVLHSMKELNFITQDTYQTLKEKALPPLIQKQACCAPHAREMIRKWIEEQFGKDQLYNGGLVIKTTLNQTLQNAATTITARHLKKLRAGLAPQAEVGFISSDTKTGAIKALIGGLNFNDSQFNRATQARRQIGSTFKPLIFATALIQGVHFSDTEIDEPVIIMYDNQPWEPLNANKKFMGQMTLARALVRSNNILAIKTLLRVGIPEVIHYAQKTHLSGTLYPYPSLALGCVDASVLEVNAMFNIFANKGMYVKPFIVEWVKDTWGTKLWRTTRQQEQVFPWKITSQIAHVISKKFLSCDSIGKTGTTNDARTCWYVGSTPNYTTTIYIGNDNNSSLPNVYSTYTAMPLWIDYNKSIPQPVATFTHEPSLHKRAIHPLTGIDLPLNDPHAITILE